MSSKLEVSVRIHPHPKSISAEEFNVLMDGELEAFNQQMQRAQVERGGQAEPLTSLERAAIKGWAWYMANSTPE